MEELVCRVLGPQDEEAFFKGLKAWEGESLDWYTFSWKHGMSFTEMLSILDKEIRGLDLAPGRVAHTMLYAFLDGEIVGRASVRHTLNEKLLRRGGHIGYAVAPAFRRRGLATRIFRQGLDYAFDQLGLDRVLITVRDDNEPSIKLIEKFGGRLENKIWDEDDAETVRRYWIDLVKVLNRARE